MDAITALDEQVLNSLNRIEVRQVATDAAFRLINSSEAAARHEKTERLRAARLSAMTKQ
jgi:hypothetical protein